MEVLILDQIVDRLTQKENMIDLVWTNMNSVQFDGFSIPTISDYNVVKYKLSVLVMRLVPKHSQLI